ncbi:MAG: tripartite tricarboxylate transporter TctB family protein [Burkholderiaceae bacterium]|nr:tripartite tricarboxylate transporter TctB family protein [Burkholderiaceae bacterium]
MRLNRDILFGGAVTLFGVSLLVFLIPLGVASPSNVRVPVLSPLFWPRIIAWTLIVLGLVQVVQAALAQRAGRTGAADPDTGDGAALPGAWWRLPASAVLMALYWVAIPRLGMPIASVLLLALLFLLVRTRYRLIALATAILVPLVMFGFFDHVAGVPIPQGHLLRLP